ncbi:MAG: nitrogenase cofactor biosynthesis protein NifB [Magnetococcales bacterium]|nr:nitrogenase cofactor biosynthesis protein NifB [Magnetococcales bacterium]
MTRYTSDAQRTDQHPCYNPLVRDQYARMHLAVAPACNIQCHYCNRKFDCANESRPGVVSRLLTPEQALTRLGQVQERLPQLKVVGIAGPGDALANERRLFETCTEIRNRFPHLILCLSTNGLALPEHAAALGHLGIHHVTITMNTLDPVVSSRIHPWIFWDHRRLRGVTATRILIENQLAGLDALVMAGVRVKINSVLIPGVNHDHLAELNQEISRRGAALHNIMPLISDAAHGTYYGLLGFRNPGEEELKEIRNGCQGAIPQMTHCRQCRADAVGLLGEEQPPMEQTRKHLQPVTPLKRLSGKNRILPIRPLATGTIHTHSFSLRVAVASRTGEKIDQHFGHADEFILYEVHEEGFHEIDRIATRRYCHGGDDCGDDGRDPTRIIRSLKGCNAVLCERIGFGPWQSLEAAGIQPVNRYAGYDIGSALLAFRRESIVGRKETIPNRRAV